MTRCPENRVHINGGKGFDWGKVSADYAKYRDIYPQEFYQKILELGLCKLVQAAQTLPGPVTTPPPEE